MGLVILDRDGVINFNLPEHVRSPEDWIPIPGSLEAIARMTHAGNRVVVVTNQSGLGLRLFDIETLNRIHEKMHRHVAEVGGTIEAVFFCPHRPKDNCSCRKPRPGLLQSIGMRLRLPLRNVPFVGDSRRDIEAARSAGARPVLVRTGNGSELLASAGEELAGVEVHDDLAAFADALLASKPSH